MTVPSRTNPITSGSLSPRRPVPGPGRLARWAAVVITAALAVLLTPAAASAHAVLQSSDPVAGSTLKAAPTRITLSFNEPVQPIFGGIKVFAPNGREVGSGAVRTEPGNRMTVGVRSGLGEGTYTVTWRVSSADSHPVAGAFTFDLGRPSSTAAVKLSGLPTVDRTLGVLLGIIRWLAFGSFALLIGASVFLFVCWPEGTGVRRARRMVVGAAVTLAAASAAEVLLYGPYAAGLGAGDVLNASALAETVQRRLGVTLLARLALLAGFAGVVWWLIRRLRVADRNERIGMGVAGAVLGVGIAATWGAAGHASTGRQVPLALPADIAHLLAMATWLGGLAVLAVALLSRKENPQIQSAVPRFSRIAFGCVVAIVLTGLYQAWRQAGGLTALTDTTYGRVLLVKLGIFGALIGLAYVARGVLRYQFGDEGGIALLRRIVAAETAIALGVLGLTAALVNLQPARDAYAADQTASTGGSKVVRRVTGWDTGSDRGGKGTVAVSMTPARVGRNSLRVTVADEQGAPRAVGAVRMTFTEIASKVGPLKADVVPGRNTGEYFVSGVELPLPGNWRVTMFIRTTDVDEAFVTVSVPVA